MKARESSVAFFKTFSALCGRCCGSVLSRGALVDNVTTRFSGTPVNTRLNEESRFLIKTLEAVTRLNICQTTSLSAQRHEGVLESLLRGGGKRWENIRQGMLSWYSASRLISRARAARTRAQHMIFFLVHIF